MRFELGFGAGVQAVELPEKNLAGVLLPNDVERGLIGAAEVERALKAPIGSPRLSEIVHPGEKIAIITSDITRPMPTYKVMPALLDELYAAGIKKEDITLVFALGSHRKHTEEEKKKLAGERAYSEIACIDGDASDCVSYGKTSRGTPVDIVRCVAEADRRICLGNIEYHYFAGYSGGAKAIMPGISTRDAIQANHSRMVDENACAGKIEGNPIREDIEEAASLVGVDFIVNVVLDEHKEIICAVAGDVTLAHREGCKFLDRLYEKKIAERADIVIVSQGGAPKDLNLYQTQKALDNAKHAVKKGGVVIVVGSCKEGFGEHVFEEWITTAEKPADLIERIAKEFRLGGHKAAAIAMVQQNADIYLVSEMDDETVRKMSMFPYASAQEALDAAFAAQGADAKVLLMPYGGSTLPRTES
ncbi:MAG: nickel-dependent lactate racemase [Clostridia bacterium]|nr:nickel-dependent lactate racemase [Clostridia bacterium]